MGKGPKLDKLYIADRNPNINWVNPLCLQIKEGRGKLRKKEEGHKMIRKRKIVK